MTNIHNLINIFYKLFKFLNNKADAEGINKEMIIEKLM